MLEFKSNQILRLPVKMVNSSGDIVNGISNTGVSVTVEKADGTLVDFSPSNVQWLQVTQTAFADAGKYTLILPASYCDQNGLLTYAVAAGGSRTYLGAIKLIANEEAETKAVADSLLVYQQGKWEIVVSGADANRLILYEQDGTTVLQKFDLQNANGDPTFINPFRRIPV